MPHLIKFSKNKENPQISKKHR